MMDEDAWRECCARAILALSTVQISLSDAQLSLFLQEFMMPDEAELQEMVKSLAYQK